MSVNLTAAPTLPDINDPATFNARALALLSWMTGTLVTEINGMDAADFFSVQSSPTDTTSGRVLKTGASATVLSASPALRAAYGGTANAITLTTGAGLTTIPAGLQLRFRATAANTGATTINVDGIGAAPAKTIPTDGVWSELPAGYIMTNVDTVIRYSGAGWIVDRVEERHSNANGRYVRRANGELLCWDWLKIKDSADTAAGAKSVTWTFPAAAAGVPGDISVGHTVIQSDPENRGRTTVNNTSLTAVDLLYYEGTGGSANIYTQAKMTGRWY